MLREALTYPLRGENAEGSLLVGTSLAVATGLLARLGPLAIFAVVPAVLLAGYALAVLRESVASGSATNASDASADPDAPPAFADARVLAVDGARALAVAVGYLAVPIAVLAVTVGGSAPVESATAGTSLFVFGAGSVVLFASLSFAYLLPAALAGVARTRRLGSAVEPGRLRRTVADARYFVAWIAALAVAGVTGALLVALVSQGRLGEVVALALGFYALVAIANLLGRGVRR